MDFQNIINKYNYEGLLAEFLPKIYQELINSLGEEWAPIIYEAFLNTEVVIADSVYDFLVERDMLEKEEGSIINEGDLKRASGISQSIPEISFDGKNYKIERVKRIVIVTSFTESLKNTMLSVLIHEICHLVKTYYNEYKIEGNILTYYSGLIKNVYEMEYVDGKVKKKLLSEQGVGFEEGLNTVLEVEIGKKLLDPNWEETGYRLVTAIARNFYNNMDLRTMIIAAQMNSEREKFITSFDEYFMDGAYEKLEELLDKLYSLGLQQVANIFNPDKMNTITKEIDEIIKNEFNILINQMNESRTSRKN